MSDYRFQTSLIKRMYRIGLRRIKYDVNNADESQQVMHAKNRAAIRALVTSGVVQIKSPRKTKRKHSLQIGKHLTRKKRWIKRVRGLRQHWQRMKSRILQCEISDSQRNACLKLGFSKKNIDANAKRVCFRACKMLYRSIGQNKIKNRNYLCKKLGMRYEQLYKKEG